jgi:hypothetical protein
MKKQSLFFRCLVQVLILSTTLSSSYLKADNILFLSQNALEQDYAVYLQTKPQYLSYVEHWLERNPDKADIDHLLEVFERAQVAYLNNPLDEAKALFENVVQLAHQSDWRSSQRELLLAAFLRLAQFEQSEEGRKHYLKRAIALDHEMEPNTSLFPPPLINEYKELRRQLRTGAFVWKKPINEPTAVVLLNGKKLNFHKPVLVVEGQHRLSLVSNRHTLWTKVLHQRDFEKLYVQRKPYANGSCEKSQILVEADVGLNSSHMFYGPDCTKEFSKKKFQVAQAYTPSHEPSPLQNALETSTPREPIWKKTWFWAAIVGVALTAAVISQNNQNSSSSGPQATHTQGL